MKRGLRDYAGYILNTFCLFGSCILGRCSIEKTKAAFTSYIGILHRERTNSSINSNIYNGKRLLTLDEANNFIAARIDSGGGGNDRKVRNVRDQRNVARKG